MAPFVDAVAVYVRQEVGILAVEGIIAVFAVISVWIVFTMRSKFIQDEPGFLTRNVETRA